MRSWADLRLADLEQMGHRVGTPRQPAQTVREYGRVLEAAGLPTRPLRRVIDGIETEAFSGRPLTAEERELVEAALADAEQSDS